MTEPITFTLHIDPHGKEAAKSRRGMPGVYTPDATKKRMKEIATLARPFKPAEKLEGPLRVELHAEFHRPDYMSKRSKRTGEMLGGYDEGPVWMTAKPDVDNISKLVLDSLKEFWGDDAQVVSEEVTKVYHAMGGKPSVRVTIRGAGEEMVAQTRGRG